jgi:hypothetical protein
LWVKTLNDGTLPRLESVSRAARPAGTCPPTVALHDDIAKVNTDDPLERRSSRVACAISFAEPTDWSLLRQIEHSHTAYRQLIGYEPGTLAGELKEDLVTDV